MLPHVDLKQRNDAERHVGLLVVELEGQQLVAEAVATAPHHPEPCRPLAAAVNWVRRRRTKPKASSMAAAEGRRWACHRRLGDRFFHQIEWFWREGERGEGYSFSRIAAYRLWRGPPRVWRRRRSPRDIGGMVLIFVDLVFSPRCGAPGAVVPIQVGQGVFSQCDPFSCDRLRRSTRWWSRTPFDRRMFSAPSTPHHIQHCSSGPQSPQEFPD